MITFQEAKQLLEVHGVTFAAMDTVTKPVLLGGKKNPFQGKVEKHCQGHRVLLYSNTNSNGYLNKVRRHLEAEGLNPDSFELSPLPWGERIEGTCFITHKGKHYIQCVFRESGSVTYIATDSIEFPTGNGIQLVTVKAGDEIPKDCIQGLNERSGSEKQGLEKEVIVRTFALESIRSLRAFKAELRA